MNEPWEQDDGLDGDDFVEGLDDEGEELGIDYTARHGGAHPMEDAPAPEPQPSRQMPVRRPERPRAAPGNGSRKFRIRAMSDRMQARSRGVVSILITKEDGSQVLLVKGGR